MDNTRIDELLEAQLDRCLMGTDLPDLGRRQLGEVRDSYIDGTSRAIVLTDRQCAFGSIVGTVPFKGQVYNQLAQYWLEESAEVAANHLISVPDPNCMIVNQCRPIDAVFTVHGYLFGAAADSLWQRYERGERAFSGHELPDGLVENQSLREPLISLSSPRFPNGEPGRQALIDADIMSAREFERAQSMARALFAFGQERALERGLLLTRARYEFGITAFAELRVIHEFHTLDTADYWLAEDYQSRFYDGRKPRTLSSHDYVCDWLRDDGQYSGAGEPPDLPDEIRVEAARRYIDAYQTITGRDFEPDTDDQPEVRVARNLGCI